MTTYQKPLNGVASGLAGKSFEHDLINDLDRFHLVGDVIDRMAGRVERAAHGNQFIREKLIEHRR